MLPEFKADTVPTLEVRVPIGLRPDVTPATENQRLRLGMVLAPPEVWLTVKLVVPMRTGLVPVPSPM
jgi:hypothetical protein